MLWLNYRPWWTPELGRRPPPIVTRPPSLRERRYAPHKSRKRARYAPSSEHSRSVEHRLHRRVHTDYCMEGRCYRPRFCHTHSGLCSRPFSSITPASWHLDPYRNRQSVSALSSHSILRPSGEQRDTFPVIQTPPSASSPPGIAHSSRPTYQTTGVSRRHRFFVVPGTRTGVYGDNTVRTRGMPVLREGF